MRPYRARWCEERDNLAKGAQLTRLLGAKSGQRGITLLERPEDLDALDRIDTKISFEIHIGVKRLGRVAGLLGHHRDECGQQRCRVLCPGSMCR